MDSVLDYFSSLFNLSLLIAIVYLLYYYGTSTYNFWKKQGVFYMEPEYPLFGNSYDILIKQRSFLDDQLVKYKFFKGHRYGGIFRFRNPCLFVMDPELIETIMIKDFVHFYNRGGQRDKDLDPLSSHLVFLKDAEWKVLRNKLTPTFTSGKLKGMFGQLIDCTKELIEFISAQNENQPHDAREVMSKFSTDVIASCAFGLNVNSMVDGDSEFRTMCKRIFNLSFFGKLRFALQNHFLWLLKLLNWRSVPKDIEQFFVNTIKQTIEYREKNNIIRQDFLHLMNELKKHDLKLLKKGELKGEEKEYMFTDHLLVANAFVFFIAGFETTSSTLGYALYELAINPDVQENAYKDVLNVAKNKSKKPTYESLKDMKYLDNVISETLRKYPPIPGVMREVTKPYKIPGSSVHLPNDVSVIIPIFSIHHDADNYPDPEEFIPERFSEENKDKIKKGSYIPFGDGPRICIGMRFALLEIKLALSQILLHFKITLDPKTEIPLQYSPRSFFLTPKSKIWVQIKKR